METKKIRRKFLGKTDGFTDRGERNFYTKMLRKYLKGAEYFTWGIHPATNQPAVYKVEQEYYVVE